MKIMRYVLSCLFILVTGVIGFTVQAQKKNNTHRPNFSGEWKAKESISMGGNIVCSYDAGDRMVSKTMKIVEQADFLTIENPNPDSGAKMFRSQEKLIFDGKTREISHSQRNRKKFTVNISKDGNTMTIKSIVYFMNGTPYNLNIRKQAFTDVTEVWNLSKDGKSISVLAKAKSNIWDEERSWKTVFDKIN